MTQSMILAKTSDTTFKEPRIDAATHAMTPVEYEHHEVHSGSAFTANYNNDVTNIGEMTVVAFNTPNTT